MTESRHFYTSEVKMAVDAEIPMHGAKPLVTFFFVDTHGTDIQGPELHKLKIWCQFWDSVHHKGSTLQIHVHTVFANVAI
jgi:hypothetical protein